MFCAGFGLTSRKKTTGIARESRTTKNDALTILKPRNLFNSFLISIISWARVIVAF